MTVVIAPACRVSVYIVHSLADRQWHLWMLALFFIVTTNDRRIEGTMCASATAPVCSN